MTICSLPFHSRGRETVLLSERPFGDIQGRSAQTRCLQACGGAD